MAILFLPLAAFAQPEKWPAALARDVQSESWAAAERVGEALAEEIDAGRMFASFAEAPREAAMRELYAVALDHRGNLAEARAERCLALQAVHPSPNPGCAAKAKLERNRRIARLKDDVLAAEVKIPASIPFARRGNIAVVAFSAAWCPPCVRELEELRRFDHPGAQIVMLDVDQLSREQKASLLPVNSLTGREVPRLYVLDREGNIRFRILGFDDDGFFAQKLSWMIDAIAAAYAPAE